jgi:hypothetical protein
MVEGAALALLWARGLTDVEEVEAYAESGLSCLYVGISQTDEQSLANAGQLMAEGEFLNLVSLVGLETRAAGAKPHPYSSEYRESVREFVSTAVSALKEQPGLVGWVIEGLSPEVLTYSDADFQRWLRSAYQDIRLLNQFWGSNFTDFSQIGQNTPAQVDANLPGQLGRGVIDLGFYRYWLYRELLDLWAEEIRRADTGHLIILGGQPDFRSLTVPSSLYDGMVALAAQPRPSAEGGFAGIHAIDIARRANQSLAFGFADARQVSGEVLYDWAGECLLHGAAGIGLEGWSKIRGDTGLQEAVRKLSVLAVEGAAFPRTPAANTAFLYEPLGGGPGYGFMPLPASEEPAALFRAFARGTRYGAVDYLTEDMLAGGDLSRYGVIFAPLAFTLSSPSQEALIRYVSGGGVLAADWGIGVYESGSLVSLPDRLASLFGTGLINEYTRTGLDLVVGSPDPLFPSLPLQAMTSSRRGAAFAGLVGDVKILGEAKRFMTRQAFGVSAPSILINRVGAGCAVFASAALWENWQRGDGLFDEFHADLISRRRSVAALGGQGLFTPEEVVLFDDGAVGVFRPSGSGLSTQVLCGGDGGRVFEVPSGLQAAGGSNPLLIFGGPGMNIAVPLLLRVQVTGGRPFLQVKEYGPEGIVLEIHGPGAALASRDGALQAEGGGEFSLTLTVPSDSTGYAFSAGSRHDLTLRDPATSRESQREIQASERGALEISLSGKALEVKIEPAGGSAAPSQ